MRLGLGLGLGLGVACAWQCMAMHIARMSQAAFLNRHFGTTCATMRFARLSSYLSATRVDYSAR